VYSNLSESALAREEISKAYALRDRVSEPERLYITAVHARSIEGSVAKTIEAYQLWIATYPKDYVPRVNIAVAYGARGEYEKAAEELRTAISLAPDEPLPYSNLASNYEQLGRIDEARATLNEALKRGLDSVGFRSLLYTWAFQRHDNADMAVQVEAARRLPEGFRMLQAQANIALFQGQLMLAKELTAQYESEVTSRTGLRESAAQMWSGVAQVAAVYGDAASARAATRTALDIGRRGEVLLNTAFALAVVGDVAQARAQLDEAAKTPEAASEDAQHGLSLVSAIVKWRSGGGIDGVPAPKDDNDMAGIFTAGVCNLDAGSADVAAQRFKQVIDWKRPSTSSLYAVAPLYYGRALAKLGRTDDSRKAYDAFFANFGKADSSLPIVAAARREYTRLKPST
jgi:tetratricopeptide (TPR) repeat protein